MIWRETVSLVRPKPDERAFSGPDSVTSLWWERYLASTSEHLSPTALRVLEEDCQYIHHRGVLGAGAPGDAGWNGKQVRKGLIVGSVQSGKTASMLGVMALAIDAGVDIVVLLSGTRISLWRQTFDRYLAQLDPTGRAVARDRSRMLVPNPEVMTSTESVPLPSLYALRRMAFTKSLATRRPIVAVALKNHHHLQALAHELRNRIPEIDGVDRPVHMMVLDDEADDGSILDARVEAGTDPMTGHLKQIPRSIVDLWEDRPHDGVPASSGLFVTYLAYTATPQANLLQSAHNPLAPTDFVVALRTPADHGSDVEREATYLEPDGLSKYYVGGELFYERFVDDPLLAPVDGRDDPLADALRAFLMAGAVKLWRSPDNFRPSQVQDRVFMTREEALRAPRPHSMLFHPSPAVIDHFAAAERVASWTGAAYDGPPATSDETRRLSGALIHHAISQADGWLAWLEEFDRTARQVEAELDLPERPRTTEHTDEILSLLRDEVIPFTRISVINSDPSADHRPSFSPERTASGWRAAADLSTIFVSGNVLSRGLTLEGLTTSLFLRQSSDPFADTQAQMQRWFGYRGADLDLLRVFAPSQQLALFRAYHAADEALRREIISAMNAPGGAAPTPVVLQGAQFQATGKIADLRAVPLCPGPSIFIHQVNDSEDDPNTSVLIDTFSGHASTDVIARGRARGRILEEPFTLTQTASLLDRIRLPHYSPGGDPWTQARWKGAEQHFPDSGSIQDLLPFYRAPVVGDPSPARIDCPHAIAGYLRLWAAALRAPAPGLFATDDPDTPWSRVDLTVKRAEAPSFYVGIRYGNGEPVQDQRFLGLNFSPQPMIRSMEAGELIAGWGSRNTAVAPDAYLGDELFDYHHHGRAIGNLSSSDLANAWRAPGEPGLVLFHLVQTPSGHLATTVGIKIPLGGPDQFAARSRS